MNELNIHRLESSLSEILSRKHNAKVTIKFIERGANVGGKRLQGRMDTKDSMA